MTTGKPSTSTGRGCSGSTSAAAPTSCQVTDTSKHPRLQPRRFGHHRLVPGRIEHELHARLFDGWNALDLVARVVDQDIAHAAAGGGESHLLFYHPRPIALGLDFALID